jgi:ABC-type nickel/cobalt efflux system permease component RcnA
MLADLKTYLLKSLKLALHEWSRGQALASLISAILALPVIVLLGGIPELTDLGVKYFAVWVATSALLLLIVVSPFRMWQELTGKIAHLEAERAPRLALSFAPTSDFIKSVPIRVVSPDGRTKPGTLDGLG